MSHLIQVQYSVTKLLTSFFMITIYLLSGPLIHMQNNYLISFQFQGDIGNICMRKKLHVVNETGESDSTGVQTSLNP